MTQAPSSSDDFSKIIKDTMNASTEEERYLAKLAAARYFGYEICDCTEPPQIMLTRQNKDNLTQWHCDACGKMIKYYQK